MSRENTYIPRQYHPVAVDHLAKKYGYTARYVRRCLRKDADGIMPDQIRKEYPEVVAKIDEALNK